MVGIVGVEQRSGGRPFKSWSYAGWSNIERFEDVLYEFAGAPDIIDSKRIALAIKAAGSNQDPVQVTDILVDLTFLRIEVQPDRFEFLLNDSERPKFRSMARRVYEERGSAARYRSASLPVPDVNEAG